MKNLFLIIAMLVFAIPALAIRIENGDNVQISAPVNEDIYVAAGAVTVSAIVRGDFFAAGGTITLNDSISGDLVVAGGTITFRGVVMDDVRAAGGSLVISGYIGGDLLVTGGTVTIETGAVIMGDIYVAGGNVRMDGRVMGNLKTGTGEFFLNGSIDKNADLNGGKIHLNGKIGGDAIIACQSLKVEPGASLNGSVRYWTEQGEVDFGNALKNGTAMYDTSLKDRFESPKPQYLGFVTFFGVLGYLIAMFILLVLGQRLFGSFFNRTVGTMQAAPMQAFGYGFLYFVVVPVAIVLLFITLVGIPVGLIALTFYILFLALAHSITALAAAHWLNVRQAYHWSFWKTVLAALGILVILKTVSMIPFVGWLAVFIAVCIVFGAILLNSGLLRSGKTTAPAN